MPNKTESINVTRFIVGILLVTAVMHGTYPMRQQLAYHTHNNETICISL